MQALKSLVIGLGILVVIGMVVVVYGIIQKASDPDFTFFKSDKPTAAPAAATGASLAPFGDIPVDIGAGCRVEDTQLQGTRLVVRVGPAGSCARVIVVDLAAGRVLGNVRFREAP